MDEWHKCLPTSLLLYLNYRIPCFLISDQGNKIKDQALLLDSGLQRTLKDHGSRSSVPLELMHEVLGPVLATSEHTILASKCLIRECSSRRRRHLCVFRNMAFLLFLKFASFTVHVNNRNPSDQELRSRSWIRSLLGVDKISRSTVLTVRQFSEPEWWYRVISILKPNWTET